MHLGLTIGTLIITVYFIKKQFEFEKVSKVRYYMIPAFGAFQFVTNVSIKNAFDATLLVNVFVMSCLIGWYQTRDFAIKVHDEPTKYIVKENHQESPIYERALYSRGGRSYIVGWIAIFILQIVIGLVTHTVSLDEVSHEWTAEILKDLLIFFRFNHDEYWWIWEIFAVSNLSYYLILKNTNDQMRDAFKSEPKAS